MLLDPPELTAAEVEQERLHIEATRRRRLADPEYLACSPELFERIVAGKARFRTRFYRWKTAKDAAFVSCSGNQST
ncbi:hypothetical protein HN018_24150 (plasmid) [Lichenicola cladoniae]|uniref:Uncharacterized protein n=1 Tax=Lichenicola cladoniae TaxID=1484109 RepID=A0A6M8HYM4_9PROT|nr:hypothetical protein [Lichenicola cladoniae]NPD70257.1 hypothetical protein [Acetobacteraceae bacterium]QKE93307.1 hypothetical protein HN018_24150 [Lichenicola cladoniae]